MSNQLKSNEILKENNSKHSIVKFGTNSVRFWKTSKDLFKKKFAKEEECRKYIEKCSCPKDCKRRCREYLSCEEYTDKKYEKDFLKSVNVN